MTIFNQISSKSFGEVMTCQKFIGKVVTWRCSPLLFHSSKLFRTIPSSLFFFPTWTLNITLPQVSGSVLWPGSLEDCKSFKVSPRSPLVAVGILPWRDFIHPGWGTILILSLIMMLLLTGRPPYRGMLSDKGSQNLMSLKLSLDIILSQC